MLNAILVLLNGLLPFEHASTDDAATAVWGDKPLQDFIQDFIKKSLRLANFRLRTRVDFNRFFGQVMT